MAMAHPAALMADPTTVPEEPEELTAHGPMLAAPAPPPAAWAQYLLRMDPTVYQAYTACKVPYAVIKHLVDDDWVDLPSLSQRFPTSQDILDKGATKMDLRLFGNRDVEKVLARVAAAHETLRKYKDTQEANMERPRHKLSVGDTDRRSMQTAFEEVTKTTCPLKYQGSKNLLGKLCKGASEGRVEELEAREIVPLLPDPAKRIAHKRKMSDQGTTEDADIEYRIDPNDPDQWQDQMRVFYYTLFMAICVHQEHLNLQVPWQLLRDFYEKFLFGPTILKRKRPPSLRTLMIAERRAWQRIIIEMWEGKHLSEALKELQVDSLWWSNELESGRTEEPTPPTPYGRKGKGKGQHYNNPPPRQPYQGNGAYQKGKSKGKAKGKNKGKNNQQQNSSATGQGQQQQRNDLASRRTLPHPIHQVDWRNARSPANKQYCRNYHVHGTCNDNNCARDHLCPLCQRGPHPGSQCRQCYSH